MAVIDTENSTESLPPAEKDGSVDSLKVPKTKKKKSKTPSKTEIVDTAAEARAGSMTPAPRSSRSKTPLTNYLQRRSEDPTAPFKFRSITPFINRQSKEKTPFELGKDIRDQLIAHKMVFDRASYMDVSDENGYEPARYITSDVAVVDRASVMDVSNVEVIYMVEEYDEAEYDEQMQAELTERETKKKKPKKGARKSKSVSIAESEGKDGSPSVERESPKPKTKTVKKKVVRKKEDDDEEEERSPPPIQLPKLKLELGGGPKINKKLFEQKPAPPSSGPDAKPPPKGAKPTGAQMEEQKNKLNAGGKQTNEISESREGSEMKSDRELSQNPEDEENFDEEEEEKEPTPEPEPEPEPTEEELAQREAERIEKEKLEEAKRIWENEERERIKILRNQMAEIEKWNRIREDEGVTFMNRIKKFIARKRNDPSNACFVNHLPNATVMEGKNVRISCSVNGKDLEIKWYKNGREIYHSEKYVMNVNLYDILSLEILNCLKVDSGKYTCIIWNGEKQAESSCFLSVYDVSSWTEEPCPPNIDAAEDSYHCANDELVIECRVHGTPRPVVTFHRDDIELKTNQIYTITEKCHGVHELIIKRPTPRDTGIYVIKATNSKGEHVRKHIVEFLISTEKVVY